ncbi:unnamed protein product [Vitrella brassicaformis CCMP3155]|uniref:Pyruvate phosphate dikinase AMP/ATP-binding domain-containing protein n=1 Tax=Vitrella brassicaformis (strain CCMP3155) TaxID=1169540 RepID=A0A0G4EHU0_VITBC|nr:unnamed protein product [Vitrella brassicaformis CCMP3155]|eukprot:CEL95760.1 unnamed protein product [Vitrella brassicaformis CCMP3155]
MGREGDSRSATFDDTRVVEHSMKGFVFEGQTPFEGRVKWVRSFEDVAGVDEDTLVLLKQCSKEVAIQALVRCRCAINLTQAFTAHIQNGRVSATPYAVWSEWTDCDEPLEGDYARISIFSTPCEEWTSDPLRDVPPVPADSGVLATKGGKAAGLLLLKNALGRLKLTAYVPHFIAIEIPTILQWLSAATGADSLDDAYSMMACKDDDIGKIERAFEQLASAWIDEHLASTEAASGCQRWAVRSSADVEDGQKDSMSGTFDSKLDVDRDGLPAAIRCVVWSLFGKEAQLRSGNARMAVVIQQMVVRPRMAGCVFIPHQADSSVFVLEGQIGRDANDLMNGTTDADVCAFAVDRGGSAAVTKLMMNDNHDERTRVMIQGMMETISRQALALYFAMGRGDMEFAVDEHGGIAWLQARALRSVVEVLDLNGYHRAAFTYLRSLAFNVALSNCIPPVAFRVLDGPGLQEFGYTHGIRRRDFEFH